MSKGEGLHRKWMKDPRYRSAHDEAASAFELARALIQARANAGLRQEESTRVVSIQSIAANVWCSAQPPGSLSGLSTE
jgi:hypothetical protein